MINFKSNNIIAFYATMVLPISFLFGSLFVNIIAASISLYTLKWLIFSKKYNILFYKNYIFLFLLFLLFILSSCFSNYKIDAFENSLFFLSCVLLLISLNSLILTNSKRIFLLSKLVFFLTILICIDLWFQRITGTNIIGYPTQQAERLTSFFGDEQIPGSFIFKLSPIAIYYLFYEKNNKILLKLRIIILIFIYFSILITGERAASILITLAVLMLIYFNRKKLNKKKLIGYSVFISLIFLILFSTKNSVIKERIFYTFKQTQNNVYLNFYENSINIFKENILLGTGPQTYRFECPKISNSCSTHPHNFVFELLSDTGVFSPLILFLSLFFIYVNKLKNIDDNFLKSLIATYTILFFFPFIPTGSFFTSFHMILSWFSFGFLYSLNKNKN